VLLEHAWQDGLGHEAFRDIAVHLGACPGCASTVSAWARVDAALGELARAAGEAEPRIDIASRVAEALEREQVPSAWAGAPADDAELVRFLERVGRESALRARIAGVSDRGARLTLLVKLGREQGFRFTEGTVASTLSRQEAANDGELSDEQLEAVAGGASAASTLLRDLLR
jgi:predicted ribosomally synthesized peptide with nif11-like leader